MIPKLQTDIQCQRNFEIIFFRTYITIGKHSPCELSFVYMSQVKLRARTEPKFGSLYPRHLCRRVYSFRLSVRPFVRLYVRLFVRSYFRHVCRFCVKVLRQSFSSGAYLSNYLSESIHIWTIVTLEGWHSLHDPRPQGPCPRVGLEVKI